ncbi:MAG: aspartate aminotransferase family protein [Caldilineae bacterium]|nr:MAG: aspartate aminotransferase family protein [Caldilineae bacterium]
MATDTQRLRQLARDHLWMSYQPPTPYAAEGGPRILVAAEGTWMVDSEGRRYLDGVSALEACVAGHIRTELADVAYRQMQQLEFLDVFRYASPPAILLAARLAEITPGDLARVHFTPGGSEAVETAIKIAKQYHLIQRGDKQRYKVITREGAYHGCTFGAMAVDGEYFGTRIHMYDPLPPFGRTSPPPYHYRCPHCSHLPACNLACVDDVEQVILREDPETVAALIFDPCATASAVSVPPDGYMQRIRELCDRYGILFIMDEIITGFGRTGRLFASEHWDIVPDIMTLSKGLSSGYMPIGAAITREAIARAFDGHPDGTLSHGQTYGGHPVACAVALANIDLVLREDLAGQAARKGERLMAGLRSLHHHVTYGDVRGLGLLVGFEFVHERDSRRPPPDPKTAGYHLRSICRDLGLITLTLHPGNVIFLAPPLTITEEEIDQITAILDRALSIYEDRYLQ